MLSLRNKGIIQLGILVIPIIISCFGAKSFSITAFILAAVLLLLLVNSMPLFHKHETKWVFMMTFLFTIPINIRVITMSSFINDYYLEYLLSKIVGYPVLYITLLCTEELVMCVLSAGLAQIKHKILKKLSEG